MRKLTSLLLVLLSFTLVACDRETPPENHEEVFYAPKFHGVTDETIYSGEYFDLIEGVTAVDHFDGDVTDSIIVSGHFDNQVTGDYIVKYSVSGSTGLSEVTRTINVIDVDLVYPTGEFDFTFSNDEMKLEFLSAAEKYLLDNMIGGIPLVSTVDYAEFSNRVSLPLANHSPYIGFGEMFGVLRDNDSSYEFPGRTYGDSDEFTFRSTIPNTPEIFNMYLYDSPSEQILGKYYSDTLYNYDLNETKDGYSLSPSLASSLPVPINGETNDYNVTVSTKWQIDIRNDLEWYYPSDMYHGFISTDPSRKIDAYEFEETLKIAHDEEWFRALNPHDIIDYVPMIKNLTEYNNGEVSWEEVGFKAIDSDTIEIEFISEMSETDVMFYIYQYHITPIDVELYDYLKQNHPTEVYGSDFRHTSYLGPYYVNGVVEDEYVWLKENPNYHDQHKYNYTGYLLYISNNQFDMYDMFQEGLLDVVRVPHTHSSLVLESPNVFPIYDNLVTRININGLESIEKQKEYFGEESDYIPEPLLANKDFRKAMYYVIDRDALTNNILTDYLPQTGLFNESSYISHIYGIDYRSTYSGEKALTDITDDQDGYEPYEAKLLFLSAVQDMINTNVYTPGTPSNPTVINLDFLCYDSVEWINACQSIKNTFEETFVDEENHIEVKVSVTPLTYTELYFDYILKGEYDLALGGVSGSTLDPLSYLDHFSSDNRSGFLLNYGFDTSEAVINVKYFDDYGVRKNEMWSFDVISSVFEGETTVYNGEEVQE